jgi:cytoskeleton protein RodZ
VPRIAPPTRREIGSGHILMRLISLAILAGALGMLALWWQNRADLLPELLPGEGAAVPAPATEGSANAPTDSLTLGSLPVSAGGESAADTPPPLAASLPSPADESLAAGPAAPPPLIAPVAEETPPDLPQPPASEPAAAQTQANREVVLSFSGSSWIDVRDSAGKSVLSGEMQKGDRHVLEGEPPYAFVIGNATSTAISVGGKPFDLGGVSRGNVARFKLDPEGAQ